MFLFSEPISCAPRSFLNSLQHTFHYQFPPSTTFHFVHSDGLTAQCEDRDRVKEKLVTHPPAYSA